MLHHWRRLASCCWVPPGVHEDRVGDVRSSYDHAPRLRYKAAGVGPRCTTDTLRDDVDSTPSDVIPACWDPRAAAAAAAATAPTAAATQHPSSTSGRHASPPAACTADTQPSTPASDYTSASAAAAGDDAHPDQASCSYPPPERLRGLDPAARQACVVALAAHEHELSVRLNGSLSTAKELFWAYNCDGDGRLKPAEFLGLVADLELEFTEAHLRIFARLCFEAADADGAGVLSLWEWVHLYKVLSATRAAFSRADTYTTAQLTWHDFMRLMTDLGRTIGVPVPEDPQHLRAAALRAFNNIDSAGCRYVTFEGVLAWLVMEPLKGCLVRQREAWSATSTPTTTPPTSQGGAPATTADGAYGKDVAAAEAAAGGDKPRSSISSSCGGAIGSVRSTRSSSIGSSIWSAGGGRSSISSSAGGGGSS